jgi:AcrR family transcriptional regulator
MNNERERTRAAHLGPERRRPQVLDAALNIAAEQGLSALSMESVAKALGVTRPVVYACYASREEMLGALLEREEQRLYAGAMASLPAEPQFGAPRQWMTAGFQALAGAVAENAVSWRFVLAADNDPSVVERYGRGRQRVAEVVRTLMEPMLRAANVESVDRKLPVLVELFMSLGDGTVRSMLQSEQLWTPDELGAYVAGIAIGAFSRA